MGPSYSFRAKAGLQLFLDSSVSDDWAVLEVGCVSPEAPGFELEYLRIPV